MSRIYPPDKWTDWAQPLPPDCIVVVEPGSGSGDWGEPCFYCGPSTAVDDAKQYRFSVYRLLQNPVPGFTHPSSEGTMRPVGLDGSVVFSRDTIKKTLELPGKDKVCLFVGQVKGAKAHGLQAWDIFCSWGVPPACDHLEQIEVLGRVVPGPTPPAHSVTSLWGRWDTEWAGRTYDTSGGLFITRSSEGSPAAGEFTRPRGLYGDRTQTGRLSGTVTEGGAKIDGSWSQPGRFPHPTKTGDLSFSLDPGSGTFTGHFTTNRKWPFDRHKKRPLQRGYWNGRRRFLPTREVTTT